MLSGRRRILVASLAGLMLATIAAAVYVAIDWRSSSTPAPSPGQAPTAAPQAETPGTTAEAETRTLTVGSETRLPAAVVVYLSPAPYATDSNPVQLWRVYRDAADNIRRDDLFANLHSQFGHLSIVAWAGDERMGEIVVTTCPANRCQGVSLGGWEGEFDVYRSTDGGIKWATFGRVPAMSFPQAITPEGVMMSAFGGRNSDGSSDRRFYLYPSGREIAAPGPRTVPRLAPGLGLVWQWDGSENRTGAPIPNYDASGRVIVLPPTSLQFQTRLIGEGPDGTIYVARTYMPASAAEPRPYPTYLARIAADGALVYASSRVELWLGPYLLGPDLLIGNANLPAPPSSTTGFDVPAVIIDLARGEIHPLRELNAGLQPREQPLVAGVVTGDMLRITGTGDCLNVRERPSKTANVLACYRDGVLLQDQRQSVTDGGTWMAVTTPLGKAGWVVADFIERSSR